MLDGVENDVSRLIGVEKHGLKTTQISDQGASSYYGSAHEKGHASGGLSAPRPMKIEWSEDCQCH